MDKVELKWELLADTYRRLFHNAFFREMPSTIYKVVGSAGFIDAVEIAARAVKDSFPDLVKECCMLGGMETDTGSSLHEKMEAYVKCHNCVAAQLKGMARLSLLESSDKKIVVRVTMPASAAYESKLLTAVRAGIVVGILRALGVEAHALMSANHERLLHCPEDCYVVYIDRVDEKGYVVVIERR
ncbi:MAG: hypothetical protein GXO09_06765 [Crenarchaeota archaeon]|nr:hypothetical protein [Thermoproteota archaeon]